SARGRPGGAIERTPPMSSNIFSCMRVDHPVLCKQLRADLSLGPELVEEVLRFRFGATIDRKVAQDTAGFGPGMKAGQVVVAWIGAANRDESHFTRADVFDIHRPGNQQHMTFGAGPHFCLGAPLARLEANIALASFVRRFPDIQQADGFNLDEHLTVSATGQSLKSLTIEL
ncbi:cytochrome, partial [Paenibacillus riograndensis]